MGIRSLFAVRNEIISGKPPRLFRVVVQPEELVRYYRHRRYEQKRKEIEQLHGPIMRVELHNGPIDGILGYFDPTSDQTHVDVLETAILRASSYRIEDIDREVTAVVAHEMRHQQQKRKYGKWVFVIDRIPMFLLFLVIAYQQLMGPAIAAARQALQAPFPAVLLSPLVWLWAYFVIRIGLKGARYAAYWLSWAERDARRYAAQAVSDPAWEHVVHVAYDVSYHEAAVALDAITAKLGDQTITAT